MKQIRVVERGKERFIDMDEEKQLPAVRPMAPGELQQSAHTIDVPTNATQHIEVRTSAVDRAQGFLISTVPLFAGLAFVAVLACVFFLDVPFFSFESLIVYWVVFVAAWVYAYHDNLKNSAEGVARYEAERKWNVVDREQKERWAHYKKMSEGK